MASTKILVLGGTEILGRELARTALARGYEVTCVARGEAGGVPEGVTLIHADRDKDDALAIAHRPGRAHRRPRRHHDVFGVLADAPEWEGSEGVDRPRTAGMTTAQQDDLVAKILCT